MLLKLLDLVAIFGQISLIAVSYMYMFRPKARLQFLLVFILAGGLLHLVETIFEFDMLLKITATSFFFLLINQIYCRIPFRLNLLALGIVAVFSLAGEFLVMLLVMGIIGDQFMMEAEFGAPIATTGRILSALMLAIIYPLMVTMWNRFVDKLPPPRIQMFFLIPVSQLLALIIYGVISYSPTDMVDLGGWLSGIMLIVFALADLLFFYALHQTLNHDKLAYQNEQMQEQLKLQFSHYEQLAENADKLQKMRHDMINHIETIRTLVESEQKSGQDHRESLALLGRYAEELAATRLNVYTANRVLDAVLVNKRELAEKNGVSFEVKMNWPERVPCDDLELCSMFANLLDNAITAASAIRDPGVEKKVRLNCFRSNGYVVVQCWNSKDRPVVTDSRGRMVSTKSGRTDRHGLGLKIVEDIAKKYDGEFRIEHADRHFQATLFLPDFEVQVSFAASGS